MSPDQTPAADTLTAAHTELNHEFEAACAQAPLVAPAGGDFCAATELPDGSVAVVVGDVAGHGPVAAAHAERLQGALVGCLEEGLPPHEALGFVNAAAEMSEEFDGFATAFVAKVEPGTGRVEYANGGHEPTLIAQGAAGHPAAVAELVTTGPPLGAIGAEEASYDRADAHLAPGATLVAYTDGVSEARRGRSFFGVGGIRSLLSRFSGLSPLRLVRLLLGRARAFTGRGRALRDDAAVLALRRRPDPRDG